MAKKVLVGCSKLCHIVLLSELNTTKLPESSMDADVTPSGKVVMFVSVFCTDCRTIFPSILELNLTSAGTGGLSVGCPKYCLLRNPGKKNSYSIAISLLVETKGM